MTCPPDARRLSRTLTWALCRLNTGRPAAASRLLAIAADVLVHPDADTVLEAFGPPRPQPPWKRRHENFAETGVRQGSSCSERRLLAEIARLARLAGEDPLTGLPNRRVFESRLAARLDPASRDERPPTLLMIDVDRFKAINDGHSHLVGDRVLKAIANLLKFNVRDDDLAARLAGDEFVVVLSNADAEFAAKVVHRIREAVDTHDWNSIAPGLRVSLSIGIASARAGDSIEDVLARGDKLMYADKREPPKSSGSYREASPID
jgi:diguanylate cyclase (GGDEF)-like protein